MKLNKEEYQNLEFPKKLGRLRETLEYRNRYKIFVEGKKQSNDITIFNNVISRNCDVYPSGGKEEILNDFKFKTINNQIAILDKDYEENIKLTNVFYTDKNDIESTAIYLLNDSYKKLYENMKIDQSNFSDELKKEIFINAYAITLGLSKINKYIFNYNQKYNKYYRYILNIQKEKQFSYYYILDRLITKNYKINMKEVVSIYKEKYSDIEIDVDKIKNIEIDSFRGHDYFMVLTYLFKMKNIKIMNLDFSYNKQPEIYLERKFIEKFAKDKIIENSNLYKEIKDSTNCYFE